MFSFNEILDVLPGFLPNTHNLVSSNKSTNMNGRLPSNDQVEHRLHYTLPQELGKVAHLTALDVGAGLFEV